RKQPRGRNRYYPGNDIGGATNIAPPIIFCPPKILKNQLASSFSASSLHHAESLPRHSSADTGIEKSFSSSAARFFLPHAPPVGSNCSCIGFHPSTPKELRSLSLSLARHFPAPLLLPVPSPLRSIVVPRESHIYPDASE